MIKNKIALLVSIVFFCNSCAEEKVTVPENVGHKVFQMLNKITETSKEEFVGNYMSLEEMHMMGKSDSVVKYRGTTQFNYLLNKTEKEWTHEREQEYNNIKTAAAKKGIQWTAIEYLDFTYEKIKASGFNYCTGNLYFKYDGKTYSVYCIAYLFNNEYKIVQIREP